MSAQDTRQAGGNAVSRGRTGLTLREYVRFALLGVIGSLFLAAGLAFGLALAMSYLALTRAAQLHFFIR